MLLSPDTLLIKEINADPALIIASRSLFWSIAAAVLFATVLRPKRPLRRKPMLLCTVFFAVALASYPLSVSYTWGTNSLVLLATIPLLGAVAASLLLRESIHPVTWIAAVVVAVGVAMVFSTSLSDVFFTGNAFGLATAMVLTANAVLIRHYGETISIAGGLMIAGAVSFIPWSLAADLSQLGTRNALLLLANGLLCIPYLMIMLSAKYLSPPSIGFIFSLETIIGSALLWMIFKEVPPAVTLIAGALIISTMFAHVYVTTRRPLR